VGLVGCASRVNQGNSLRIALGNFHISIPHTSKKSAVLALEPAFVASFLAAASLITPPRSFNAGGHV
jgi:hypothetical protein